MYRKENYTCFYFKLQIQLLNFKERRVGLGRYAQRSPAIKCYTNSVILYCSNIITKKLGTSFLCLFRFEKRYVEFSEVINKYKRNMYLANDKNTYINVIKIECIKICWELNFN